MKYKDEISKAMLQLGADPKTVFIGYNVGYGSKGGGSFKGIPDAQLIEMPLAENLMAGVAIGMSVDGYRPILFFERFDFVLNAMDAIVNHLDKARAISKGEFSPACIIRVVVGNSVKPLFTGATHVQDFSEGIRKMVDFKVYSLYHVNDIEDRYEEAHEALKVGVSTMLVEYKDCYDDVYDKQ